MAGDHAWFDELELDPDTSWLRMGTRQLGDRPWLVIDDERRSELAQKRWLVSERHGEVFAAEPGAEAAGRAALALVGAELAASGLPAPAAAADIHPLDAAGRSVQEDLCLLHREDRGWVLAAASLCFPSRWRLADKIGRPLGEVHAPVPGYDPVLVDRVDRLLDRLGDTIVWRRNWFVHPDGELFQPVQPPVDPVVPAERCADGLFCRSERQTLRRLDEPGWALFTIRIQQATLGTLLADPVRRARFARFLDGVEPGHAAHRGLSGAQLDALRSAVTRWRPSSGRISRPTAGGTAPS